MAAEDEVSIVDSGTMYTPESAKMRRRLAEAMMKQGLDTSPIASHWQGLARIANAMIGGYQAHRLEREEKDSNKLLGEATAAKYGLGAPLSTSPGSPQPPKISEAAPLTGDKAALGRKIAEAYVKAGYTPTQAAAIAGNMVWEGGGRTDLVNPGDNWRNSPRSPHSIGIGQWNDRAPALLKFARENGIDIPEGNMLDPRYMQEVAKRIPLETQIAFAQQEKIGPEARANAIIKATPDDLTTAMKGAISYHRPAGWSWNAPERGHGFEGRMGLARSILDDITKNPLQPAQVAQAPTGTLTDAPPMGIPGIVLGNAPGVPPVAAQSVPAPAAPTPAPAAPAPVATPGAPAGVAPAPITQQEALAEAWRSLGPNAAVIQTMLRHPNPAIRAQGEKMIGDALTRVMNANDPKKRADLTYTQSQIAENQAQLPKHQADARKANAEARKTELESEKLLTREEGYARGLDAISKAAGLPDRFGKFAFERGLGPVAGAQAAGAEQPALHSDPVGYIGSQIAKIGGMVSHGMEGGASPAEVQAAVGGLQAELGQMIRKANGMSAKEGDSNVELQNFLKMVGQLPTATSVEDYQRRLYDVNLRFARMMGQEPKDVTPFKYGESQKAPEARTTPQQVLDKLKAAAAAGSLPSFLLQYATEGKLPAGGELRKDDGALERARAAISKGANPEAVAKRLRDNGIDPAGL